MANEVTDEIRQAVYEYDCARLGHEPSTAKMFRMTEGARSDRWVADIGGPDDDTMPHVFCQRCGKVWLVVSEGGSDYEDAERKLYGMLRADLPLAKRIARGRAPRDKPEKVTPLR